MAQEYEFEVINMLDALDFVTAISPMAATDKGFDSSETIHQRYANSAFNERFDEELARDGDEYPAVYQISFKPPEFHDLDFDEMMTTVEEVINEYHPVACIGNYDPGVPNGDFSGWDVDPIVDVLCVRSDLE